MTKLITPKQASEKIKPGSNVFIQGGIGEPKSLLDALATNPSAGDGVNFFSVMVPGVNNYVPTDLHKNATFNTFFVFGGLSDSFRSGRTKFFPLHYSQIPHFIEQLPSIDTVLIQTSPPDSNGQCNLGPTVDFVPTLLKRDATVIAEINEKMPVAIGSPAIDYSSINYAVKVNHSLPSAGSYTTSIEVDSIAEHVTQLIDDGDTLQFGIGNIPNAVLSKLGSHRHLGLHSGMITEAVELLIKNGVFTSEQKTIDIGKHITGFALGSEAFYQWVADFETIKFCPVSYTHDLRIIAALRNFVSINSAVQVDLLGQVNVEMLNGKQISGTGGALDFIRGARLANNGRSIIALPATAKKGTQSRIVPRLNDKSIISVPRTDVDYVVTEYGVAKLAYKSMMDRAAALIKIAAPQFRAELTEQWQEYLS